MRHPHPRPVAQRRCRRAHRTTAPTHWHRVCRPPPRGWPAAPEAAVRIRPTHTSRTRY